TTVGRRAAQWGYELHVSTESLLIARDCARCRGLRGATGTQASYLTLFDGDATRVAALEDRFMDKMRASTRDSDAFSESFGLVSQTYPRVFDAQTIAGLGCIAAVLHKIATDIRLLSNRKEIEEPFERDQIGSSAM